MSRQAMMGAGAPEAVMNKAEAVGLSMTDLWAWAQMIADYVPWDKVWVVVEQIIPVLHDATKSPLQKLLAVFSIIKQFKPATPTPSSV